MRYLLLATLVLTVFGTFFFLKPEPAHCAFCYQGDCSNTQMCGSPDCVCLKRGLDLSGFCFSKD